MSCIEVTSHRLANVSTASALYNYPLTAYSVRRGYCNVESLCKTSYAANSQRTNGITARSGIICTRSQVKSLNVHPKHVWLMPENMFSADAVIVSNIEWYIN